MLCYFLQLAELADLIPADFINVVAFKRPFIAKCIQKREPRATEGETFALHSPL